MAKKKRKGNQQHQGSLPEKVHQKAHFLMQEEGLSREQAYGKAAGMNRSGRLTREGHYIRKHVRPRANARRH
jgi:hypothetical protein